MKKSNLFITILSTVIIVGMFATNITLKNEYQKIDVSDPFKNYISIDHKPYSVLDISGSNGYPIQIISKKTNDIKVLRSRVKHFKSELRNDTLYIKFTGSNIPSNQRYNSNTPYGIIIENDKLASIISKNTHNRIFNLENKNLHLTIKGNSFIEMSHCNLDTLQVDVQNSGYIDFTMKNKAEYLDLKMSDKSIVSLQNLDFKSIKHSLKDSVSIVLSKDAFNKILK
ncbi:hypothetical protein OD91_0248 [Lutibacter sp. Hel_I_33_5]|uniref:GIN domain-containing protein n=1 Tax=Lutibacter sp. Hel_I_33_5 TaxID=1566289 RepID=UPI0011A64C4E|nr:DUF2807 domain-containing protein [Lutibacter sp. Hel_I_33_5]TVZ55007.1 hypothetical protein OD91_0248 [Lutibacter sp. Hel_I_33_5]